MVQGYSLSSTGEFNLSNNFKVKEFRCKDGNDLVLVDSGLVWLLQSLRDKLNVPIIINSAYRTPCYNKSVGGSVTSYHMIGMAADIRSNKVSPDVIASTVEQLANNGAIIKYPTFVHVDTRQARLRQIIDSKGNKTLIKSF